MTQHEIYWDDLTEEAKKRVYGLYHENVDDCPIAIIEIDEKRKNDNHW